MLLTRSGISWRPRSISGVARLRTGQQQVGRTVPPKGDGCVAIRQPRIGPAMPLDAEPRLMLRAVPARDNAVFVAQGYIAVREFPRRTVKGRVPDAAVSGDGENLL